MRALAGGKPLHIGYEDEIVVSPDGRVVTVWRYVMEPPHGDGLFEVRFQGIKLPHLFWGRGHAWSKDSDYFSLEQFNEESKCFLWVVRSSDQYWCCLGECWLVARLDFPVAEIRPYGDGNVRKQFLFDGSECWQPIG